MKRQIQVVADCFSIINDQGTIIVASGNKCQIIDCEGQIKDQFEVKKPVRQLLGSPMITIGCDGEIFVVDQEGTLLNYLFPVGYENSPPSSFSYNSAHTRVAVCVDSVVLVYDLTRPLEKALVALLQGHEAPICTCSFLTYTGYEHLLISCSEDSRFLVWDLDKRLMCYESPFESSSHITGISTFSTNHLFTLAFDDGFVRLYDASPILAEKPSVKFVKALNLTRAELEIEEEEEEESIIISKVKPPKPLPKPDVSGLLGPAIISASSASIKNREFMICSTENSIISLNIATFEKEVIHTFDAPITTITFYQLICASRTKLSTEISLKRLTIGHIPEIGVELFPKEGPPDESVLNSEVQPKTKKATPIATLHKVVKSSGYSSKPPPARLGGNKKAAPKKKESKKTPADNCITDFKIPKGVSAIFEPHSNPILTAAISPDGKRLLTTDNSGTVVYVKGSSYPAFSGHSQPIVSISWGMNCFLTASTDGNVKFWNIDRPDPLLTIQKVPELTSAGLIWDDRFAGVSSGDKFLLYGYKLPQINTKATVAVNEMHQTGSFKRVFKLDVGAKITGTSMSNMPVSPIVLYTTSSRILGAIDLYTGQKALEIETQHERVIHTILGNYGGMYTPRTDEMGNLALTAALDETCRLWDLRSARCERTIVGGSRTMKTGVCFSPDSKYIAIGTERLGVEFWEIASGKCIAKIKDDLRATAITWMDWNPSSGKVITANEKGTVKILS